ncbi:hypothetical protein BOO69_16805 [Sulfitobacter alexandrii]|uniref:DUF1194 domain-containing protein n=1 Tax=Sulfitobacter alexandrii TaxID=1917485 RepID=A0A1J0WL28_9RHOB|nr:DUF1194 domain-containing protein [Sulfitobacter alexandrii]APE44878.1 hypothetical protein BOO69_16805 [Sulfitobacter alexandrii]
MIDRLRLIPGLLAVVLALTAGAGRPADAQTVEVDLELVLMVDVSRSMSQAELELQRRGYAEALGSTEVFAAVQSGLLQNVALTYVEWAGTQQVVVDWRVVTTRQDLQDFARQLTTKQDPGLRRTSISGALAFGASMIERNQYAGLRRVIDISGDGPNNLGPGVTFARDDVLARGITINGLPLMTDDGAYSQFNLPDLDVYYQSCVIGGPGAFVIPVVQWSDFGDAVKRKLVLEIAGYEPDPQVIPAQARDPRDCRVGEKIWEDFFGSRGFLP